MKVAVLGAGGWGTALSIVAARNGHQVSLWARSSRLAEDLRRSRKNSLYLPMANIPRSVRVDAHPEGALAGAEVIVIAVPSHGLRSVLRLMKKNWPRRAVTVSAVKGIERGTWLRMSQVIQAEVGRVPFAVLSGPTLAHEVALGWPSAAVVAGPSAPGRNAVTRALGHPTFRLYHSSDVVGVEYGGAFKNVMAIASGIADGLGLGDNAKAALYTRGLAEMARLAAACGGRLETSSGLAGLGDLMVTCTSRASRNRTVGVQLGAGRSLRSILAKMTMVAEGVYATKGMVALARQRGVSVPIAQEVASVLFNGKAPRKALSALLARPSSKREFDFS